MSKQPQQPKKIEAELQYGVNMAIDAEVYEKLRSAANAQRIAVSDVVEAAILKFVGEKNGTR